ncbi:cobalt-precorrin 5A hydrolase [Lactobacillus sp. 3B(2020)]|uniref:cobalt-precorrin 5A hydrolase n=1 Tax=Lactobacillus sp. 3B(2020) TaxID=2695882 RepID=UPI0015DE4B26|nr:cobalt-precorrin 5A hydrolase [Lactobacillus sp. 3B(2020)]QLL69174.1 cobalamin biosynthesis protein CbiG [Lactobacillus sp. 3B(2020)]
MDTKFAIIALTKQGSATARKLQKVLQAKAINSQIYVSQRYAQSVEITFGKGEFQPTLHQLFTTYDCVICIMATGIVVRSIAPWVKDKRIDPAVIVMDEQANHVISLLSGHIGGANEWAHLIGEAIGADPVITTATDTENVQALDILAKQLHAWYPNFKENTKLINGRLAAHEPVNIFIDSKFSGQVDNLRGFNLVNDLNQAPTDIPLVVVSDQDTLPKFSQVIPVIPQQNVLGVGCRKNVPNKMMQEAFFKFCQQQHLLWQSFAKVASIDIKQHEGAIQYLAQTLGIPVEFYSATALQAASKNYPGSTFVKKTVGVASVACAAADVASGRQTASKRFVEQEVTMAVSQLSPAELAK